MGMQTVWDHIWLAADRTPDNIAVVDDRSDRRLTFAELVDEVETAAAGLAEAGLRPGQYVATVLPNVLQHVIARAWPSGASNGMGERCLTHSRSKNNRIHR